MKEIQICFNVSTVTIWSLLLMLITWYGWLDDIDFIWLIFLPVYFSDNFNIDYLNLSMPQFAGWHKNVVHICTSGIERVKKTFLVNSFLIIYIIQALLCNHAFTICAYFVQNDNYLAKVNALFFWEYDIVLKEWIAHKDMVTYGHYKGITFIGLLIFSYNWCIFALSEYHIGTAKYKWPNYEQLQIRTPFL